MQNRGARGQTTNLMIGTRLSEVWAFGEDYHCTRLFVIVCLSSLMQRRYSEPNTYIDTLPSISHNSDDLYDDVASIADPEVRCHETRCNVLRF